MNGNIWIILGIAAGAFSLFAIPYGFHVKNVQKNSSIKTKGDLSPSIQTGDHSQVHINYSIQNDSPKQITENDSIKSPARYNWQILKDFRGPGTIAIWVKPKHDDLDNFRFFFPSEVKCIDFGHGTPNRNGFTGMMKNTLDHISDTLNIDNQRVPVYIVGSTDVVSHSLGCYIVFKTPYPSFVGFAYEQFNVKGSINRNLEVININL